ncbi:MAG: aminoacyl-tRNA hydrolase [candidate division WOR-3 bacterium]
MDLVVVGLGNVGLRYVLNRHNVGFMVVDYIANKEGLEFEDYPSVLLAKGRGFYLVKPKLFMNNSGKALLSAPIPIKNMPILVIYDDADLPFGKVRFKVGINSIPSHKGLRDIYESLNRSDIMRLRIGISKPPKGVDLADWVLSNFSEDELKLLPEIFEKSYDVVKLVVKGKLELVGKVLS